MKGINKTELDKNELNAIFAKYKNSSVDNDKHFNEFIDGMKPHIKVTVRGILNSEDDVEDVTSRTNIKILHNRLKIDENNNPHGYILTIASNEAKDYLKERKKNVEVNLGQNENNEEIMENIADPDGVDFSKNISSFVLLDSIKLLKIFNTLKKKHREVIFFSFFAGLEPITIAYLTNMNVNTIRGNKLRALTKLRYIKKIKGLLA